MKQPKNQSIVKNEMMDKIVHASNVIALACNSVRAPLSLSLPRPLFPFALSFCDDLRRAATSYLVVSLMSLWAVITPTKFETIACKKCVVVCCSLTFNAI